MSIAVALIEAIIKDERACALPPAKVLLERALLSEVDPLVFLVHASGLDEASVYARAARFCGLAFSDKVPDICPLAQPPANVDRLAEMHSARVRVFDRDIAFVAPSFAQLIHLASHARERPEAIGRICVVPPRALRAYLVRQHADGLVKAARQRLARMWPFASAHLELTLAYRLGFLAVLGAMLVAGLLAPFCLQPVLVPLMVLLLLLPALFRIAALVTADRPGCHPLPPPLADTDLPSYSILVPLRDEAGMVPQLADALRALDYPAEKLDIKFIVESTSPQTVAAVRRELGTAQFELLVVPAAPPLTKPKALDVALPLVRGEFVVVYDAEDIPEPGQVRLAACTFADDPGLDCLQAELVAENAAENWLTALFGAEYGGQFGIMLPALCRWGFPMPLGGTSNHFRTRSLREIGGWDAFNVTEDADIGIRLSRLRYRTRTLCSQTLEEAPVTLNSWMRQRTRWMKGWMQTFLVHNRHPLRFARDIGWRNFLAFEIYVGGLILSPPLHTLFMGAVLVKTLQSGFDVPLPTDTWTQIEYIILITGYASAITLSLKGMARLGHSRLAGTQLLLPLYWGLMGVAAFKAAFELVTRPYFWAKTAHGQTRMTRGSTARAASRDNAKEHPR